MAKTQISGDVKTTANPRLVILWETELTNSGKEIRKRWSVWFTAPHALADGDWIEVRGDHSDKIQETKSEDGTSTIATWTRSDGQVLQNIDRIINNPELIAHNAKHKEPAAKPVDQDDLRKYGTPF
jgi:hypothetical protein